MKKWMSICLSVCLMAGMLTACGGDAGKRDETVPVDMVYELGETGVKITLPTEVGFEQRESELNDFFGIGASGEWSIIVNSDEKGGYTLDEYANLTAEVNDAYKAIKDPDGSYYFTYSSDGYWFYTAVREGAEKYYRIAFYCFGDVRTQYAEQFEQWAKTIEVA